MNYGPNTQFDPSFAERNPDLAHIQRMVQPQSGSMPVSGSGGGGGSNNLSGLFQGVTAPYNASAPNYGAMPQQQMFPAFMPGQMEGIASQLSQGFGAPQQSYMDQMAALYKPVGLTQMSEPLTQSMRAWGLKPSGQPGGVEGSIKGGYQQYGMQTGSPWLDKMFGLQQSTSAPAATAPVNPYDQSKNPRKWRKWNERNPAPTGGIV
jgi:hypothetical protein